MKVRKGRVIAAVVFVGILVVVLALPLVLLGLGVRVFCIDHFGSAHARASLSILDRVVGYGAGALGLGVLAWPSRKKPGYVTVSGEPIAQEKR